MDTEHTAAFGRGKVILLGEHAVVYGVPAIAASLARGVAATVTDGAEAGGLDTLEIPAWSTTVPADATNPEPLAQAFAKLRALYPAAPPMVVRAEVGLPAGAGLGCSAAIGVAIVRALDARFGVTRTDDYVATQSLHWERVFHGNPSGVDSAMAAGRGVAVFERGKPLESLILGAPLVLVVGHSGAASSTKAMVSSVARQYEDDPAGVGTIWDAIAVLVTSAKAALVAGDVAVFGRLMDANHALLTKLSLSTTKLDRMCNVARRSGALGAKITGAGGGGCAIALAPDSETASRIAEEWTALGHGAFVTEITP